MRLLSGTPLVVLENAIGTVAGAVFGILCARLWGPELGGTVALSFTFAGIFHFIACLGTDQIVIARLAARPTHQPVFAATLFLRCAGIGLGAVALVGTGVSSSALQGGWTLLPLLIFAQMALGAIDVWRLRAQALSALDRQVAPRLAILFLFFAIKSGVLVWLPAGTSVWLVQALTLAEFALYLLVSIRAMRAWPDPPEAPPAAVVSSTELRAACVDILRASLPLFAAGGVVMAFFKLDYLVLGMAATPRDLGLYSSAMRIVEMYTGVANFALLQMYPHLARSHAGARPAYLDNLRRGFMQAYLFAAGIVVFNLLVGQEVVLLLLGAEYAEVAHLSTWFCLLAIPLLSGTVRGFAISLDGLHRMHIHAALIGFAASVPLLLVLVPALGFRGALIADLTAYALSALVTSWLLAPLREIARLQWLPLRRGPA